MIVNQVKSFVKNHRVVVENFSYMSILQVVLLLAPLITYPYLVRVLGMELYGVVISAQVLMGYASIIIDFGTNSVCAKHVSINRNNKEILSEIVSSVIIIRLTLALLCFCIYMLVVLIIPIYRQYTLLFVLTYGMTMQEVLFPQYFFQGIEKMKYATILSILIKAIFIVAIFFVIKTQDDYIYVPLLYMLGYTISSALALYIVVGHMGIRLITPNFSRIKIYAKDSLPIFATDIVTTIKDKFNYFFVGSLIGMAEVTIYDLGIKLNGLVGKPFSIMQTVMFPRFAKSRSIKNLKRMIGLCLVASIATCILFNMFLPYIVDFFLHEEIDMMPIRLLSLAPVILSVSVVLAMDFMVAFGYNKYVFYSILITTIVYLISLGITFVLECQHSLYSFVYIALISYLTELIYRLFATRKIIKEKYNEII